MASLGDFVDPCDSGGIGGLRLAYNAAIKSGSDDTGARFRAYEVDEAKGMLGLVKHGWNWGRWVNEMIYIDIVIRHTFVLNTIPIPAITIFCCIVLVRLSAMVLWRKNSALRGFERWKKRCVFLPRCSREVMDKQQVASQTTVWSLLGWLGSMYFSMFPSFFVQSSFVSPLTPIWPAWMGYMSSSSIVAGLLPRLRRPLWREQSSCSPKRGTMEERGAGGPSPACHASYHCQLLRKPSATWRRHSSMNETQWILPNYVFIVESCIS